MTALRTALTLALAAAGAGSALAQFDLPDEPAERGARRGSSHDVTGLVGLVQRRDLPAPEAGVLTYVGVRDGSDFQAEDILAKIDSRDVEMAYKIAGYELKYAVKRTQDDIEEEYARAQEGVADKELERVLEVNRQNPGTVPATEVEKTRLELKRATLGIKKALKDRELSGLEADVKRAEMQAAAIAIEKRLVRAKFGGEVLKLHREEGEWVQPGDTIAEVAQLDTLQVDGAVYFDEHTPREVADCRVTIRVDVGRGRVVEAPGYITYVNPLVEKDGRRLRYGVRAEFANRQEDGRWLVSPGLPAKMTIHLGTSGEAAAQRRVRPAR